MGTIIFIIIAVIIITAIIYFSMQKKTHCPNCNSNIVVRTGKKIYKENPAIAVYGSPNSYHELEYKCNNCGHTFWEKQKAIIFN